MSNNASSNVQTNLITNTALVPLAIISNIIIARILGPEDKGNLVFFGLILGSIIPIVFIGSGNGIIYHISRGNYSASQASFSISAIGISAGLFTSLLVFLLWHFNALGQTGNNFDYVIISLLLIAAPLQGLLQSSKHLLIATDNFKKDNIINLFDKVFLSIFLFAVLFSDEHKLLIAISVLVSGILLKNIMATSFLWTYYKGNFRLNFGFLKDCFNYGIKAWVGNIANHANQSLDQLFLSFVTDSSRLGIYSIAYSMCRLILILPASIAPVLFNTIAKMKNPKESAKLAAKIHGALNLVLLPVLIFLFLSSPIIIPFLYGAAFKDSITPFKILIPGIYLFFVSRRVFQKWLGANGYPLLTSKIQLAGLFTSAITFPLLIPAFDIIGAAVASFIAYAASTLTCYYYFNKISRLPIAQMFTINSDTLKYVSGAFKKGIAQLKSKIQFKQ